MQQNRPLKKVSKVTKSKIIDVNTGEIQEEEEIIDAYVDKEPDYVKLYLKDIIALNNLPKGLDKVINVLLKTMSYDNMIILNSFIKKQMTEELGYKTVQVLNNNINKLVNAEILFRKGTGTYQVNAHYFGRGHWHDIQEIRLEQIYSSKGRDFKTEITYKNEGVPQN
ncbi:replication/maintenance protein RepL (plasmid) [Bacillus cereus]|uniref:replication/maintenance protein RepL n=1 Tax=Bacillus cereus TaxID=1396 RepID=UPI001F1BE296|nr:replication/maintenance protein RepL [Bacillus cereus]UIJ70209.1 replication/maintenance protein RepL [Bacillus cereus]